MSIAKSVNMIEVQDWDNLVSKTYGRPYNFQQQDDCQGRGTFGLTIPSKYTDDFENDSVPEVINGEEMGVSFKAWLERDPETPVGKRDDDSGIKLFWERNFYPNIEMVANDLHEKGLIEAGDYVIEIDLISFREKGEENRYLSFDVVGAAPDGVQNETNVSISNEQDFDSFKEFISNLNWND